MINCIGIRLPSSCISGDWENQRHRRDYKRSHYDYLYASEYKGTKLDCYDLRHVYRKTGIR